MSIELVIFDCDGVLVDSEILTVEIEARVLTEMGFPTTPADVVREFMGKSDEKMQAELTALMGSEASLEFDRVASKEIVAAFEDRLQCVDGVVALIDMLHDRGIATCVASSGSHKKMRFTLGITGLWERFEGRIFSASEVQHGKPAPDLFLHAAERMNTAPQRCAVIEDSIYGVQGAVAAGMHAFGYAGGLTPEAVLRDAGATIFHAMRELETTKLFNPTPQ